VSESRGRQQRKPTSAAKRRQILVFTEGLKTEPIYLTDWYRRHRERVLVKIDPFHGARLQLVEAASRQRAYDVREAKRRRGDPYDEYWCVFDVDQHPRLREAIEMAAASGISVALSNPCVELWFLLHFDNRQAPIDRHDVQDLAAARLGCGKVLSQTALNLLFDGYRDARRRAMALDMKHEGDGSPPMSNPSSSTWRLLDTIREAAVPEQLA
jgi:hypothetical protein